MRWSKSGGPDRVASPYRQVWARGARVRSSEIEQDGSSPRAGWYADPESAVGERWWNGSQWTSHTRAAGASSEVVGSFDQPPLAWSAVSGPLATLPPTATTAFVPSESVQGAYPPPFIPSPSIPPGWYPDPHGLPIQRWWDGGNWSASTAPLPDLRPGYRNYLPYPPAVVAVSPPKSVGVAFVLTLFFGPLGMLYSTVSGALIMMAVSFFGGIIVGILTLGLAWLVWGPAMWLTSIIWGCIAAEQRPAQVVATYR